ncbi:MAG TPA: hypothetical protein DDY14_12500 [Chromatiaceae bacterium]|jgi:type IV pilus assembly protein PilW|nr:MAG: hypothetical protein N838_24780 [Thiohalocapsa sp. PB-PSB1]QQO52576.1 MAG: hypothetical protein N838_03525 [Thiohalocapsa sp. PB-PSB1]HBG96099.1 hypothetical protein [Chromatiaceae bacterium]HCS91488.1 hypothetical protein [Chromatiaceae bacterium]
MKLANRHRPFYSRRVKERPPTRGFSIAEILVAVALGLLVLVGIVGLFVTNKRVYSNTVQTSELQENGRFAIEYLLQDLRHAYFFGEKHYDTIETDADPSAPKNADVYEDADYHNCDGPDAIYIFNDKSAPVSAPVRGVARLPLAYNNTTSEAIGCISDAATKPDIPSDILILKSVKSRPLDRIEDLTYGTVYIASNRSSGVMRLYTAGTVMPSNSESCTGRAEECLPYGSYWPYHFAAYYVRDPGGNAPFMLARKIMQWDDGQGMKVVTQDLIEGVEGMRFLYGIEGDNGVLTFQTADNVTNWADVVAVRLYLLLSTLEPDASYRDENSYTMGDTTVTSTRGSHYRRILLTTTVMLRNQPMGDS